MHGTGFWSLVRAQPINKWIHFPEFPLKKERERQPQAQDNPNSEAKAVRAHAAEQQPQNHTKNPEAVCLAAEGWLAKRVGRHVHKEVPSSARIICITVINHLNNGNSRPREAHSADPCPLHTQGQRLLHSHVGNMAHVRLGGSSHPLIHLQ